jgi:SAM-dependent methyltransferase
MRTLTQLIGQAFGLWRLRNPLWGFYRIHLVTVGVRLGLFAALDRGSNLEAVAANLNLEPDLLGAWLAIAKKAGLVRQRGETFELSRYARTYLLPASPHYLGHNFEEAVLVEGALLQRLPDIMRSGKRPEELPEAAVIGALSSIMLEPFAFRVLRSLPVRRPGYAVLDVGCGHGDYLRFLAHLNPSLTGVGVEITEKGAALARQRVEKDALADRIRILQADARTIELDQQFDLCLLNNNLYYFHPDTWRTLFQRLGHHLKDYGNLAVQVPVIARRSDPLVDVFDLYMRAHTGLYGVPAGDDVRVALVDAGFAQIKRLPLWPWGDWVYLIAKR